MVTIENLETSGFEVAIRGMRNPLNSWAKSDSYWDYPEYPDRFILGPNDLGLACRLIKAGPEHRKFLRMIHVSMDITGPLYWWKEMDTYKVSTVANSCSTMHKIHAKEFTLDDFSHENLIADWSNEDDLVDYNSGEYLNTAEDVLSWTIYSLNFYRNKYLEAKTKPMKEESKRQQVMKRYWWQMIQLLPSSYNQKRTWDGNFETVLSILHQRDHHKLTTDWEPFRQYCFENIPYCKVFYDALYGKDDENA